MKILLLMAQNIKYHAFAWKLAREKEVAEIYAAEKSARQPGARELVRPAAVSPDSSAEEIGKIVRKNNIELLLMGSEFMKAGSSDFDLEALAANCPETRVLAPTRELLKLTGSSAASTRFFQEEDIPVIDRGVFSSRESAQKFLKEADYPLQLRRESDESLSAEERLILTADNISGAGEKLDQLGLRSDSSGEERIIIDEIPAGDRMAVFALSDGETLLPFSSARICRRVFSGGEGPLTPGMGGYSPLPAISLAKDQKIYRQIMMPIFEGLKKRGMNPRGFLEVELIMSEAGPRAASLKPGLSSAAAPLILPRLKEPLAQKLGQAAEGEIKGRKMNWQDRNSVNIMLTSGGYPLACEQGFEISGLEEAGGREGVHLFYHAMEEKDGRLMTAGGRVLGITALADDHFTAVDRANRAAEMIGFQDKHYRQDIGSGAVLDLSSPAARNEHPEAGPERDLGHRQDDF